MEKILELANKKSDKAEVFRISKDTSPACFLGGKLSSVEGENSTSTGLRVIVDGKLGFSSTTHPDDVDGLVNRAVDSAQFGPETDLAFPTMSENFGKGSCYDEKVAALTPKDLIQIGEDMMDVVKSDFPEIGIEAEVSREIHQVSIMNSNGGNVSYEKTIFQSFLNVLLMMPSDRAELEDMRTSTVLNDDPIKMAQEAVWRFKHCEKVVPVKTKKMNVLFTSLGFRGLFVPFFYGLNGDLANRKLSLLSGREGEAILDSRITLTDDPTLPGAPGSSPVDDEGCPTKKSLLIENGILNGFFYDLRSSGLAGKPSTGNGFKKSSLYTGFSVDAQPNPIPSNFVIKGGDVLRSDLISQIEEGIIVDDLMGAGQGNNMNGEFSMSVALGYKIEKGEIVGRVKDVMVAGNVFDILKNNLHCLSKEEYMEDTLFGRYTVPWISFQNMPVSAT